MINEMARLMKINALNMIALHFRRRLHQYIRFRYAPEGKLELTYRETKRLVDGCFRVKSVPEKDVDGKLTGKMVKVWTESDETEDETELALRAWLGIVPRQWLTTVPTSFASWTRVYSLLAGCYIISGRVRKINASTLHGLFLRVIDQPKVEVFLKNELNVVPTKKRMSESERPFTVGTF
ncbi:hypothetical protein PHYPSEUDO_012268 [Phytophthora pseudosyringae]|uniref:Uncharacterized protein n=1 Tax=Phytophthora pseudosyringae TaxID=221518 RepID=A0A8T1V9P0_9STRA|nr:hypothetical protein PHYPSEUDO_012268 [Phytophthora pseudosyringae]